MPLYSYECGNCGVQFERMQKFADKPIKRCPECSKNSVKRIIQPAGIIFKGSGWYKTDSRSSSSASIPGGKSKKSDKTEKAEKSESKSSDSASTSSPPSDE